MSKIKHTNPSRKAMLERLAREQALDAGVHPNAVPILQYLAGIMNLPSQTVRVRQTLVAERTKMGHRTVKRWFRYLLEETEFLFDLDRGLRNRSHRYRLNLDLASTNKAEVAHSDPRNGPLVAHGLAHESSLSSAFLPLPEEAASLEERKDAQPRPKSPSQPTSKGGVGSSSKKKYKRGDWIPNRRSGWCTACTVPLGPQQGRSVTFYPDSPQPTLLHCPAHWDEAIKLAKAGKSPAKHKGFADLKQWERDRIDQQQQMAELQKAVANMPAMVPNPVNVNGAKSPK